MQQTSRNEKIKSRGKNQVEKGGTKKQEEDIYQSDDIKKEKNKILTESNTTKKTAQTINLSTLFESAPNQDVDRIIVADDQALNIETISRLLEKHDVLEYTSFATNGQEAIDCAKAVIQNAIKGRFAGRVKPIGMMLLDLQMPIKNGIRVV